MRKKTIIIIFLIIFFPGCIFRMGKAPYCKKNITLNEMLGYEKKQKLLIINCDDIGMHPALTDGAVMVMKKSPVKSASIIVNDRNDKELNRIAQISRENPGWGFGIHLSLNNEYQEEYPWTPVLSKKEVPTLYNEKGLAWKSRKEVLSKVNPREAEKEWEAQILKAQKYGILLSHIDSHMGTYFFESQYPGSDPDGFRNAALRLAKKFNLPMIINTYDKRLKKTMVYMDQNNIIRPDLFIGLYDFGSINKYLFYKGSYLRRRIVASIIKMKYGLKLPFENKYSVKEDMIQRVEIYRSIISNEVKPGINHLLIHPGTEKGYDGTSVDELKNKKNGLDKIIRLSEKEIWSSDEMQKFLEKENIKIINYKMLMEIQRKGVCSKSVK